MMPAFRLAHLAVDRKTASVGSQINRTLTLKLKGLTQDMNKGISVNFTPERRGDVAKSIRISG